MNGLKAAEFGGVKAMLDPILCSQVAAAKMLSIGKTKLGELISSGELETVKIGARRLVKISSVKRLAGVEPEYIGQDQ